ncbi:MAG: hypothetical protein R6X33_00265 [Candidatus Brocadiia bacterium]
MEKPALWKLSPEVVTKPWGLLHESAREITGIEVGLGEFWLASAQTGPGNYSNTVSDPVLRKTLAELLAEAASEGEKALEQLIGSGPLRHLREKPHRGKTEAWCVRMARGRTGVVAGPRTHEDAERLQDIIQTEGLRPQVESWSEEVRELFGIIEPLQGGEVFMVPAGTLHTMFAIGPDSRLIIDELQQGYGEALLPTLSKILMVQDDLLSVQVHPDDATVADAAEGRLRIEQDLQDNPTVRVYDFGRRPGEYPELGFRLTDPEAGLRLVEPLRVKVADGHTCEVMLAHRSLARNRHSLAAGAAGDLGPRHGSYRVLHCLDGEVELRVPGRAMALTRGETAFVPGCLEEELSLMARMDCELFDDAFPDITVLSSFLGWHGAQAGQIEALLSPPRALPPEE